LARTSARNRCAEAFSASPEMKRDRLAELLDPVDGGAVGQQ
jgi:hypothetical protein